MPILKSHMVWELLMDVTTLAQVAIGYDVHSGQRVVPRTGALEALLSFFRPQGAIEWLQNTQRGMIGAVDKR